MMTMTRATPTFLLVPLTLAALSGLACAGRGAPAAANAPPEISDATPAIGAVVQASSPTMGPTFQITVSDQTPNDDLHVRWIADFPPDTANTRVLVLDMPIAHRSDGKPLSESISVTPNCLTNNLAKIPQHQIMAVVANRPFDDSATAQGAPADLTRTAGSDGLEVLATWTLALDCP
jgi:hypothetical protein